MEIVFSVLVFSTKKQYSSFFKKVFIFQSIVNIAEVEKEEEWFRKNKLISRYKLKLKTTKKFLCNSDFENQVKDKNDSHLITKPRFKMPFGG